jgi:glycosyltransferase involved in cell wall biosynthesis
MRLGFVTEQHSGHPTFERHLRAAVAAAPDVEARWHPIAPARRGPIEALPPLRGNWAARASARARSVLARHPGEYDALLFHTQAAALLSVGAMRRTPTLISVDATPDNLNEVAAAYDHPVGSPPAEAAKRVVVRRALRAARIVVAWSEWVRRSLLDDYRVDPRRIRLIPAGTDLTRFRPGARRDGGPPRILIVATEFERKGGQVLLDALRAAGGDWRLDVVTRSALAPHPGVAVHRDLSFDDPRLPELYAQADVFALPTLGDCSPHVLLEAMAAGLPVVTTRLAAIPEIVTDGESGILIERGDVGALTAALGRLMGSESERRRLGAQARARAEDRFDAARNARAILDLMREVVVHAPRPHTDTPH